ncbi:TonB-dependent receptor [Paremcibacter congregatus]|uniref:TonB-dependent receptor n=1 Tax=Paremcibacter congregatus TaxID=2043170 RepID=A0A2G4YT97_9PROT|nr:TonB-dependent receptor [Paremcibacter congregatus]PHZ85559.1 TonB-dependent receptor [Paremcibacter congregatus]QDE26519.1 TonB-dependent receptor [Paremcibacter congregatus]
MSSFKSNMKGMIVSASLRKSLLHTSTALAIALATTTTFAIQAEAQVTTSGMKGVVTSGDATVGNATVVITHTPSGSRKTLTTGTDGVFNISGLRVGGPYSISVTSDQGKAEVEGVYLTLGEMSNVPVALSSSSSTFEEIVVTGSAISGAIKMGMATTIDEERRKGIPATSRELHDFVKIDPLVTIDPTNSNAISIAGSNNRYNSITVDGIKQNDDFGLNNGGFPTQRSPISLDAIDQLAINASPFSAEYGGFTGGNINIVTKSGTNDFHGTAFFTYRDDGLTGTKSKDDDITLDFSEKIWGGTLGGPIVKDKLFFFVGFEKFNSSSPNRFGPAGTNLANEVSGITEAELDRASQIANDVYGFDAGTAADLNSLPESDRKIFAKLDWNINEDHRAAFTYQNTEGNKINPQNQGTSFGGSLSLPSNWYDKNDKMKSYSFQLFSDWSDSFSTEVKIGRKEVETLQEPLKGNEFAQMRIRLASGSSIYLGPDQYRHQNFLSNDGWNFKLKATYYTGDHEVKVGMEYETLDIVNVFNPQSNGVYEFQADAACGTALDCFEARTADTLFYSNATSNNKNDALAEFSNNVMTVFLEDVWTVNEKLTMTMGVRYTRYGTNDEPLLNQTFATKYGFNNNETLDGRDLIAPRVGFNYLVDERTTIRGGVGLFSGGNPNVWISNNYTNDGVTLVNTGTIRSGDALSNVDGFNIHQDALKLISDQAGLGTGSVNYLDPEFKIPSVWKFNLAIDHEFNFGEIMGDGYNVTAEALITTVKQAAHWEELRASAQRKDIDGNDMFAPDGRPIYTRQDRGSFDLGLTNDARGDIKVFTLSMQKQYDSGFDFFGAYTYTDSNDVNPGTSSTATSNYSKIAVSDRENFSLATSNYEVQHRFVLNMNYVKEFIDGYKSRFSMFVTSKSGRPFSYTYDQASSSRDIPFGGGAEFERRDRQLIYVPTSGDSAMCYTGCLVDGAATSSAVTEAEFMAFLSETGLDKYAGEIAPRNSQKNPWITTMDFRFTQEIPGIMDGHKGIFTFDVQNLTNLLNSNWGRLDQVSFPSLSSVGRVSITDDNQYVLTRFYNPTEPWNLNSLASVWKIRLGVRYEF